MKTSGSIQISQLNLIFGVNIYKYYCLHPFTSSWALLVLITLENRNYADSGEADGFCNLCPRRIQ